MNESLAVQLDPLVASLSGHVGLVVKRIGGDVHYAHQPTEAFPAASLIKVPLLWEYGRQIAGGQIDPLRACVVPQEAIVGGRGIIRYLAEQPRLRCQDMAALMIVVSDNCAANLLIDALGGLASVNMAFAAQNLAQTQLRRYLMDESARLQGQDNTTSAADMATVLERIALGDDLPPPVAEHLLTLLKGQQSCAKLPADLPLGTAIAHKTGELPGVEHDAGILYRDDSAVIVVVMTRELHSNAEGRRLCRAIGLRVYDWLGLTGPRQAGRPATRLRA